MLVVTGGVAYYRFALRSRVSLEDSAYVLADSLPVMDAPAEVRLVVGELKKGARVNVLGRTRNWARVRLGDGRTGWVEARGLLDSQFYEAGQRLLDGLAGVPAQATGHPSLPVNLRLEPSRDAPQLALLDQKQSVEIFGRRLVDRPAELDHRTSGTSPREAWYLVRTGSQAGWVLGRLVSLNIPEPISMYAQDVNVVAWLALNAVEDGGKQVPQYLLADRIGTQDFDFNHVRVLTWWKKRRAYATAYRESNLNGHFPVRVAHINGIPYFRLRLTDDSGRKFQRIYGLFDTITRPVGTVEGWTTDAMPTHPWPRYGHRRSLKAPAHSVAALRAPDGP